MIVFPQLSPPRERQVLEVQLPSQLPQSTRLYRLLNGHSEPVGSAAFNGDGKRVVTASYDRTARIWDVEDDKEVAVLKGHADSVSRAAFSGDGKRVVTASGDKTARIWDAESGNEVVVLKGHAGPVSGLLRRR